MGEAASGVPPARISFGRYVLDSARGCLLLDEREITLRPKTFAVLQYLAQHPGKLVSKDELFEAVWPGLIVTDDTLVQSIGELRRALGEEGGKLIVTVPRRGYRFDDTAAPPERRKSRGGQARSWRWIYGLLVPLACALVFTAIWLLTRRDAPEPTSVTRPAIAVLPFLDQSDDASREYLADGITQDLINSLGRFSELTVMSWNAVASYKGAVAQPGEIARVLAVRYQVEGSVRQVGDRLRVSAQLVDVQGKVLWSARFDESTMDLYALQDRISREIAAALAIRVSEFEQRRVAAKSPSSFDAYELVLRARPALKRPTRAGVVESRALLRQALAIDPTYAAAHAALGETYHADISMGWAEAPGAHWNRVLEEASLALEHDPANVRARILLARRHMAYNRYDEAERELERALEMNPNDADALAGRGNVLLWLGKTDDAIDSLRFALRIDPELNAFDRFALCLAYYIKGRYEEAIEQGEINLRKTPDAYFNLAVLAAAYAQANRPADVERTVALLRSRDPTFDAMTFGNKFRDSRDLARLREGFTKAGIYSAAR
jgi:TolB-like protein/DNA-binding winged helix-turn-helix (wHTH) protein/Tfp pilus assembly protein PilF